jgi:glycosyltransferase involved in cell wall biosynthesis
MRAVALVAAPADVCCRYRVRAFLPSIPPETLSADVRALPGGLLDRWRCLRTLPAYGVVLLQRRLLSWIELRVLRVRARRLVFDFDDAVYHPGASRRRSPAMHRQARFRMLLRHCDAIIAGNDFLAAAAQQYVDPARVHVIPTCIDPSLYPPAYADLRRRTDVQLVWIGSSTTMRWLLQGRAPLFDAIGRAVPAVRLKVICDAFPRFEHLPVLPVEWSEAGEARELAAADIGVSWMPDGDWSRGKCGLKLLQYMAAGLPVVASPVGVQAEMVEDGQSGFLVRTPTEWIDAIRRLVGDAELRRRLGQRSRQIAEERYNVRDWASAFARILTGQPDGAIHGREVPQ